MLASEVMYRAKELAADGAKFEYLWLHSFKPHFWETLFLSRLEWTKEKYDSYN